MSLALISCSRSSPIAVDMRRGPFKGLLPLGLALLCFETILLFSGSPVAAKRQQCRLEPHGKQVALQAPTNTGVGGDVPNATSTATATNQQSTPAAVKATGSASSAASPTPTPFNYETQKIRGVNMFVFYFCSLVRKLTGNFFAVEDGWCSRQVHPQIYPLRI